jgi:predicted transcriptional regulator
LESQKKRVQDLQEKVTVAKSTYSKSLRNLEDISESIHARRKLRHLWYQRQKNFTDAAAK